MEAIINAIKGAGLFEGQTVKKSSEADQNETVKIISLIRAF
jgi:hypothetical protein